MPWGVTINWNMSSNWNQRVSLKAKIYLTHENPNGICPKGTRMCLKIMSDSKLYRLKRFLKLPLPIIWTLDWFSQDIIPVWPKKQPMKSNRTDLKSASLLPKCPLETVGSNWISSSRRSSAVVVETTSCWTGVEVVTSTSLVVLLETLADLDSSSMNGTASPSNTDDKLELTNQVSLMVFFL